MIHFFVTNGLLLLLVAVAYFAVTRRRARIYLLIDHIEAIARRGMSIQVGLRMVGEDLGGFLGTKLAEISRQVQEGASLGDAFANRPHTLPPLLRRMILLGEESGNLAAFMGEVRRVYRRVEEVPLRSAAVFVYPILITLVVGLAFTPVSWFILPKFQSVLHSLKVQGAWGNLAWWLRLANQGILLAAVLLALYAFAGWNPFHFGASPLRAFRNLGDRLGEWVPVIRDLRRQHSLQVFSASVSLMLKAGASLPEAVRSAMEAEPMEHLRRRYGVLADHLDDGALLGDLCRDDPWFPRDFAWFVASGEASGVLGESLRDAAMHLDTRARYATEVACRLVIPIFLILNGIFVAAILLYLYYPISLILGRLVP